MVSGEHSSWGQWLFERHKCLVQSKADHHGKANNYHRLAVSMSHKIGDFSTFIPSVTMTLGDEAGIIDEYTMPAKISVVATVNKMAPM